MRDLLLYSSFDFSGNYRSCRPAQIVVSWPIPPVRTPLEMEASLLDSDVLQELLGAEELAGDELTSNPQLQGAT